MFYIGPFLLRHNSLNKKNGLNSTGWNLARLLIEVDLAILGLALEYFASGDRTNG